MEEALGVFILFPEPHNQRRETGERKGASEDEISRPKERKEMSKQYREAERFERQKHQYPIEQKSGRRTHLRSRWERSHPGMYGRRFKDIAIEAIERKLKNGKIVAIDKTVAFATYPVGNHNRRTIRGIF